MYKYCKFCGIEIQGCSCVTGWRNLACSLEHYQKYMQSEGDNNMGKILFRIETINSKTDDIISYDIGKGLFKSNLFEYKLEDINTFYVAKEDFVKLIAPQQAKKAVENTSVKA